MAAPRKGEYQTPFDDELDRPVLPKVDVYRLTPVTSAAPEKVLAAIQTWWDELPVAGYHGVNEQLTWKLDGCTFLLTIKSGESE